MNEKSQISPITPIETQRIRFTVAMPSNTVQVDQYLSVLLEELPVKQSVKLVVKMTGENKNDIYRRALELKEAAR